MVETTLYVALVAFHVRFLVSRFLGQCLVAVSHSVRFDVGFGHYINTVFVAEFVPEVVVRIVTGSYGVDVELLHNLNVLNHAVA